MLDVNQLTFIMNHHGSAEEKGLLLWGQTNVTNGLQHGRLFGVLLWRWNVFGAMVYDVHL